jgi:hypothetical protein
VKDHIFFLGGGDAEMAEIRAILAEKKIPFHDRGLSWGARISDYEAEIRALPPGSVPVLVELTPDGMVPQNAVIIDHHGEQAGEDRETSIEQVAALLGVELNRRRRLIAANDRGHIRAMQAMGAAAEEIREIRALDRSAQGVTAADERLAERSVAERMAVHGAKTAFVESLTERTSPITDRLWDRFEHIFIRTPEGNFFYSGKGHVIQRLKVRFENLKKENAAVAFWYGGALPEQGFFGANTPLGRKELATMTVISHHIFMFPFTMEKAEGDDRDFLDAVRSSLSSEWRPEAFSPTTGNQRYSEYYYFHPFVREAMFGNGNGNGNGDGEALPPLMTYFVRDAPAGAQFQLWVLDKEAPYILDIQRIALRIYDARIGILCLELVNRTHEDLEDILKINDYGRRIYPQFLGDRGVANPKESFLPDRVEIHGIEDSPIVEDFADAAKFRKDHPVAAKYIQWLLGDRFTTDPDAAASEDKDILFRPTIDDRMYTVCWYGSDDASKSFSTVNLNSEYVYENSTDWYRFVFLDGNEWPTCQHPGMRQTFIRDVTYERWADYGTLFGISRYSLVCVTDTNYYGYVIIRDHMRRHYAQMAALLLAQRASILRFSDEVTRISRWIKGLDKKSGKARRESIKAIQVKVERLHADYIRFVNRMWFTEITPQEQGIEMYNMAVSTMHLKTDMEDLKAEIKELYEFISMLQDRTTNNQMSKQTILGTIFLPMVVLTGFFGMNLMIIDNSSLDRIGAWIDGFVQWPDLWTPTVTHWALSLLVLLGSYSVIRWITGLIIKMLDGKDSDILTYLKIRNWFKPKQ